MNLWNWTPVIVKLGFCPKEQRKIILAWKMWDKDLFLIFTGSPSTWEDWCYSIWWVMDRMGSTSRHACLHFVNMLLQQYQILCRWQAPCELALFNGVIRDFLTNELSGCFVPLTVERFLCGPIIKLWIKGNCQSTCQTEVEIRDRR